MPEEERMVKEESLNNPFSRERQIEWQEKHRKEFDGLTANLKELVFQALGEASMCWVERPKGVFDSDHAKEVGERLVADIKHFYATANIPVPTANPQRGPRGMDAMPNPTQEQTNDPMFLAIWEIIKHWDVNVPEYYVGYCGATGSHVMLIFNALHKLWSEQ